MFALKIGFHTYLTETMELLKNDAALSSKVQELELITRRPRRKHNSLRFDVEIFGSLKGLRKIVFDGWPFRNAADQDRFSAIVSEQCVLLGALVCRNLNLASLPTDRLSISRLKTISWRGRFDGGIGDLFLRPPMDVIKASLSTIVELTLPSTVGLVPSLWSLTLPKLRSLSLGPRHDPVAPGDDLAYFLSRHPTLESFSLNFDSRMHSSVVFRSPVLPSSCPNLKHITANILTLTKLLNAGVGFLERLESLSTGHDRFVEREYIAFNDALVRYGKLRAVKALSIITWGNSRVDSDQCKKIKEGMVIYAESFPGVERWTGFVPEGNRVRLFSLFRKLKEIEHNWYCMRPGMSANQYVRRLAARLPSLEGVVLSISTDKDKRKLVFEVNELDEEKGVDEDSRGRTRSDSDENTEPDSDEDEDSEGSSETDSLM